MYNARDGAAKNTAAVRAAIDERSKAGGISSGSAGRGTVALEQARKTRTPIKGLT